MDVDPPSAYATTASPATTATAASPAFASATDSATAPHDRLDFTFSFPSLAKRHDPLDLSRLSASAPSSSSSVAPHNGSISSKEDDDDDFGDFESVPAISSIAALPDFSSMNWTQNLYGSFSSGLDPSPVSTNDGRKLSGSVDMFSDLTSVNSSSSSSFSLQSKKGSGDLDAAFKVRSTGLGSADSKVSPHLSYDFASGNAHGTSASVDIFSDFMGSSSSSNSKKESGGLEEASKAKSMDTYFDVRSKNFAFENLFDNHTLKNALVSGANVDLFSDFTASDSGSSSFQLKKESSKLDPSTTRSWEIDSELHTKKHSSQDIFGEFTSTASNKVTSKETAPTVNVVTVQEESPTHFPGSSDFPSIKDSNHFGGNNGSLSKMSVDDDWGDFVEYSDSASASITQHKKEDLLPNTTALMTGNATTAPIVKAESLNGNSSAYMLNGLDFFNGESFSHADVDNTLLPQTDDHKAKAKAASRLSGLQRTQSANLTDEIRRGSSIEMSAPIPLSLFGEEEPEFGGSTDEPLQPIMPQFQGHSLIKSLSIDSLPSGAAVNFSQMIASLYPVAKSEFPQNDVFQMNIHDTKEELNSKVRKVAGVFDGVNDNNNSSEGDPYNLSLEVCLFDLNLAPSSKQGLMQDNNCTVEERNDEATSASLLHSASLDDQNSYIKAWANVLAVCASELQHALDVWNQAQKEGVQQDLLTNLEAKRYFAAIGQIYVVSLILASTLNICKSWLKSGSNEIDSLLASLQCCRDTWLQTNLKEAVQFSLEDLKGFLPSSLVSWNGIEKFPSAAQNACTQAPGYSDPICRLSLLPLLPFTDIGLSGIQWSGSTYFLPLANLWAKYVSAEAPSVPSIRFKSC